MEARVKPLKAEQMYLYCRDRPIMDWIRKIDRLKR